MAVAGTVIVTKRNCFDGQHTYFAWTANAAGALTENYITANGYFVGMELIPGTASDAYDLTLLDSTSLDLLGGTGANMSNLAGLTLAERYYSPKDPTGGYYFFINERLQPVIANGGNLGTGTIIFKFSKTLNATVFQ